MTKQNSSYEILGIVVRFLIAMIVGLFISVFSLGLSNVHAAEKSTAVYEVIEEEATPKEESADDSASQMMFLLMGGMLIIIIAVVISVVSAVVSVIPAASEEA